MILKIIFLMMVHRVASIASLPTTVKRLVLVRHGEVDLSKWNGKKVFYGGYDIPLSAQGRREALAASTYIAQHEV